MSNNAVKKVALFNRSGLPEDIESFVFEDKIEDPMNFSKIRESIAVWIDKNVKNPIVRANKTLPSCSPFYKDIYVFDDEQSYKKYKDLEVYVSGPLFVLTEFLLETMSRGINVTLFHWSSNENCYVPQKLEY